MHTDDERTADMANPAAERELREAQSRIRELETGNAFLKKAATTP